MPGTRLERVGDLRHGRQHRQAERLFVFPGRDEHARPRRRREWHGALEFRVVGCAELVVEVCPGVVKHVLAVRVRLDVSRHNGAEPAGTFRRALDGLLPQRDVARQPPRFRACAPGGLYRGEERVQQEWAHVARGRRARVPLLRRELHAFAHRVTQRRAGHTAAPPASRCCHMAPQLRRERLCAPHGPAATAREAVCATPCRTVRSTLTSRARTVCKRHSCSACSVMGRMVP